MAELWVRDGDEYRKVIRAYENHHGELKEISIRQAIEKSQIEYEERRSLLKFIAIILVLATVIAGIRLIF